MKKWLLPLAAICFQTALAQQPNTSKPQQIYNDAIAYLNGAGKSYDPAKAVVLFKESAALGHGGALNALGNLYANGRAGCKEDINAAIDYYRQAGAAGYSASYYNLAAIYKDGRQLSQDFRKSAEYLRAGADLGNVGCKKLLAYYYFKGFGIEQDYTRAFNLYKEVAETGNANAQYFLGLCYRNGYGVGANQEEARRWLAKAVQQGDQQAMHELTAEAKAENTNIHDPALQQKVEKIKNYQENLVAAGGNDISGIYKGYAVYYDFSGRYVHEVLPLSLTLRKTEKGYEGSWAEGETLTAAVKGMFSNNNFNFDPDTRYSRSNYYSYRTPEEYQFKSAKLSISYMQDSMYLAGNLQFFSISRNEPGQPMYIMLAKKVDPDGNPLHSNLKLAISPNPATTQVRATLTLSATGKVSYEIIGMDGKSISGKAGETLLPAGTYSFPINVRNLPNGSYALRITTSGGVIQTKTFIKQ